MEKSLLIEVPTLAKHDNIALILFGSYSRGDYNSSSDIDILEVTKLTKKPYSVGKINFSTYTLLQLKKMANEGNLFILHIILEGQTISGNSEILNDVKHEFKKQKSYENYRNEILAASKLLDLTEKQFKSNTKGYYGLLCYLFRSYLYSTLIDQGYLKFSIQKISKRYEDKDISTVFSLKHKEKITYSEFLFCKSVFQKYAKTKFTNQYGNSVNMLQNLKESSQFAFSIALHFLKNLAGELYVVSADIQKPDGAD